MYNQNPSQTQQWNPNAPPPTTQPQQQWSPQPPSGQPQYAPRPNQIPPISQAVSQGPVMQTLQPQHPDQYRALPAPPQMYPPPYQPQQQMGYPPNQPAPRQRTAIACRYCRRRKIRCSGFDQSEDGRCTNCQRFSQECVFTPVSAQTQAFVPAHTVWRGQNPPPNTQLYGAYGQPLPPHGSRDQYPPQQPGQQQPGQQQPGQYPPPPQGYQQQQQMYQQPPPNLQPVQGQQAQTGQKRPHDEPHTPTHAPPMPAEQAQGQRLSQQFAYPDQSGLTAGASPASSIASFHSAHPPTQTYYAAQPPAHRASSSPHVLGQSGTPAAPTSGALQPSLPAHEGHAANAARQGVAINETVGPFSQQQQQVQQAAAQAAMKQEEHRTFTDSNIKEADGTAAIEGAEKQVEVRRHERVSEVKDVGVQTDDLQALL